MARRRKRRRSAPRKKKQDFPGWAYGLFGLAVGLSVAAAVWVNKQGPAGTPAAIRQPASLDETLDDSGRKAQPASAAAEKQNRFDFYEMLPNFEVIVPEEDPEVAADAGAKAIVQPGIYVLQAGSFTAFADADRRRAELALQGIASQIQKVIIDDKTYHRVRIGPIEDLDELNLLRSRLRAARIDVLRIRLGE